MDDITKAIESTLEANKEKLGFESLKFNLNIFELRVPAEALKQCMEELKSNPEFDFNMFLSVTAVDYMDEDFIERPDSRFELVYHLLSFKNKWRLRIKVTIQESNTEIDTVSDIWRGADYMEREVWDMYGIKFTGHPDLRRILMYDEFKGHPLRKDYPIQGKQPRVPLIHPEVENTAKDMLRPDLVNINKKNNGSART